jgi:hypothetical protein
MSDRRHLELWWRVRLDSYRRARGEVGATADLGVSGEDLARALAGLDLDAAVRDQIASRLCELEHRAGVERAKSEQLALPAYRTDSSSRRVKR